MKLLRDTRGQDLIEFALLAGLMAVSAGAILPGVSDSVSGLTSKINSVMVLAADNGSDDTRPF